MSEIQIQKSIYDEIVKPHSIIDNSCPSYKDYEISNYIKNIVETKYPIHDTDETRKRKL